ncbi:RND transporter [Novosphingobium panipatense]|jgi:outer membrane protein TolC|uniref:RND transporter n=1 Tax=Novosphingobium TaxID=165696 RepID=UPI001E527D7A|nr:RND transporter [Novosphingobium sp. HII-3]
MIVSLFSAVFEFRVPIRNGLACPIIDKDGAIQDPFATKRRFLRSALQHDCFDGVRCYRMPVSRTLIYRGRTAGPALMLVLLACAGCASQGGRPVSAPVEQDASAAAHPAIAAAAPWWREAGDPVLATLVQQGLDQSPEVACRIGALRQFDQETAEDAQRLGTRLGKLLGARSREDIPRLRDAKVERVASERLRLARRIALAYIDVRRLQQDAALRSSLIAQYKDNAQVARFRREAGLVPAIDGSLARSQGEAMAGELGFAQGRSSHAIAELARLVGDRPEALAGKLGSPGVLPDPPVDPLAVAGPGEPRRAGLADAILREARLSQSLSEARRTVKDARTAYREGVGSFATLYVAEAAALAVELALVSARADRVATTLDIWSGQDERWAREGLEPVVGPASLSSDATITVTAGCD